jgi:tetratricopeptide (TPR) repeat protein/predicted nucleic acid-binding protein
MVAESGLLVLVVETLGPLAIQYGSRALHQWRSGDTLVRASRATQAEYPGFPGAGDWLLEWARADQLSSALRAVENGRSPDVSGFVHQFSMLSGLGADVSARMLSSFFQHVQYEIFNGPGGNAAVVARIEETIKEGDAGRNAALAGINERLGELSRVLEMSASRAGQDEEDELASRVRLARLEIAEELVDHDRLAAAEHVIDMVASVHATKPPAADVEAQIHSIRGRVAVARGDNVSGLAEFEAAAKLDPESTLGALRVSLLKVRTGASQDGLRDAKAILAGHADELEDRELGVALALLVEADEAPEALALIDRFPEHQESERVVVQWASALARDDQEDKALELLGAALTRNPGSSQVKLLCGASLADLASRSAQDDAERALEAAAEAEAVFRSLAAEVQGWEVPQHRWVYREFFAATLAILGNLSEAASQSRLAVAEFSDDLVAIRRHASILISLGQSSELIELLAGREDAEPDFRGMLGAAYLHEGRTSEAISVLLPALCTDELEVGAIDSLIAAYDSIGDCTGEDLLAALTAAHPRSLPLLLASARRLQRAEQTDDAIALIENLDGPLAEAPETRLLLATLLSDSSRFSEAADVYESLVVGPTDPLNKPRLTALYRADRVGDALALTNEILTSDASAEFALDVKATLLEELGDLEGALDSLEALASLRPYDARIHHSVVMTLLRLGREAEARTVIESLDPGAVSGEPRIQLELAGLAAVLGNTDVFLDLAYRARRLGDGDPAVHLRFNALMIQFEKFDPEPGTVSLGSGIELTTADANGRSIELLLLDPGDQPLHEAEMASNLGLAEKLLGLSIGDEISDISVFLPGLWTVSKIWSKRAFMCRQTYRYFEDRFGPDAGMTHVTFDDNDLSPLFQQLDERAEVIGEFMPKYRTTPVPLYTLSRVLGRSLSQLWREAEASNGRALPLRFQLNTPEEHATWAALSDFDGAIVVELTALRTLARVGLIDDVLAVFPKVFTTQATIDYLLEESLEARALDEEPGSLGGTGQGEYFMTEASRPALLTRRGVIDSLAAAARRFNVRPSSVSAKVERLREVEEPLGPASVRTLELAQELDALLLTDDHAVAALAKGELGLTALSSQGLIAELGRRGRLELDSQRLLQLELCRLGYQSVYVSLDDMKWLLSSGLEEDALIIASQPPTPNQLRVIALALVFLSRVAGIEADFPRTLTGIVRGLLMGSDGEAAVDELIELVVRLARPVETEESLADALGSIKARVSGESTT